MIVAKCKRPMCLCCMLCPPRSGCALRQSYGPPRIQELLEPNGSVPVWPSTPSMMHALPRPTMLARYRLQHAHAATTESNCDAPLRRPSGQWLPTRTSPRRSRRHQRGGPSLVEPRCPPHPSPSVLPTRPRRRMFCLRLLKRALRGNPEIRCGLPPPAKRRGNGAPAPAAVPPPRWPGPCPCWSTGKVSELLWRANRCNSLASE